VEASAPVALSNMQFLYDQLRLADRVLSY